MTGPEPLEPQTSRWNEMSKLRLPGVEARSFTRNVRDGVLVAIVAEEPDVGWHLSISYRDPRKKHTRYPSWDEIAHARYALLPDDIDVVMPLPRIESYIACHPTTFHLIEHPPRPS